MTVAHEQPLLGTIDATVADDISRRDPLLTLPIDF